MVSADQRAFGAGSRDPRIDFFRGLALYMIFVDHVASDPLAGLTYRVWGFSDAAEVFVFLSGLACGIAYSRIFVRQGLSALFLAITKRAGRIYFYYALSSAAIILLVTAATRQQVLEESFGIAVEHPLGAMWSALCLVSPPPITGIFVLYIVLTLVIVPTFLIAGERYRLLALAACGAIWAGSQIFFDFMAPLTQRWYLNPLAWQFLFAIGAFVGMKWDSAQPILPLPLRSRWIIMTAWTIVIAAFLYRVLSSHVGFDVAWLRLEPTALVKMKENLSPARLVHFLSVALLVAVYFRPDSSLLKSSLSIPVAKAGMRSLELFSLTVVLDVLMNIIVLAGNPSVRDRLLLDGVAFLLMAFTAIALTHRRKMLVKQSLLARSIFRKSDPAFHPKRRPRKNPAAHWNDN
jgi:hypothetical protein